MAVAVTMEEGDTVAVVALVKDPEALVVVVLVVVVVIMAVLVEVMEVEVTVGVVTMIKIVSVTGCTTRG